MGEGEGGMWSVSARAWAEREIILVICVWRMAVTRVRVA